MKQKFDLAMGILNALPYAGLFIAWFAILSTIPAWVTHVVACIQSEQWFFLIAGAIAAPIGVIHGYGIWFGAW